MKKAVLGMCFCLCLLLGAWCTTAVAAEDVRLISTADELFKFAEAVKADANQYAGKKAQLTRDIDLGGQTWTPIDAFSGELDGNGKTIRNFTMGKVYDGEKKVWRYSFFSFLGPNAKVHDLTIEKVTATIGAREFYATLASTNGAFSGADSEVKNVHVKDVDVSVTSADTSRVGGLFSMTTDHVSNCSVENITVTAPNGVQMVGGFASILDTRHHWSLNVESCTVNGFKLNAGSPSGEQYIGGFAAYVQTGDMRQTWKNLHVKGIDFTVGGGAEACVGGFAPIVGSYITAENCSAQGTINASQMTNTAAGVGGFFANYGWSGTKGPYSTLTNCTADVDITSGGAVAGGFVAYTLEFVDSGTADNKQFDYEKCTANGNVTNPNGIAGGFVGIATRGVYHLCRANGLVNGKTAGGFIGEVRDWKPTYPSEADKANFKQQLGYDANRIKVQKCEAKGTVLGSEQAGGLIGNVGKSLNGTEEEGASGKLIVKNCTTAPSVIGAKKSTQVNAYMNSAANSKATETSGLSGKRTTATPTDAAATLAMDQNGDVTIPQGGADVEHTDDPALKWIPVDATILRDGSIRLPGAYHAPKTGVDGADKYMLLALASLLGMMALTSSRRKNAHR